MEPGAFPPAGSFFPLLHGRDVARDASGGSRAAPGPRAHARRSARLLLCALATVSGCDDQGSSGTRQSSVATSFMRLAPAERPVPAAVVLDSVRSFDLEESSEVINVEPVVSLDGRGFLVADVREGQLRRYDGGGKLRWHAGRKGEGPGEFVAPTAIARLRSGEILAADRTERLSVFDSAGTTVLRTLSTPLAHIEDLVVVDDSLVLIAAVLDGKPESPRLHLWNVERNRPAAPGFFAPFAGAPNPTAALVAGWTKVAVRDGVVAAIFATSDTVYFFTPRGEPLGSRPIPFLNFRRGTRASSNVMDPRERAAWLSAFDFVADVHWLPDGTLLVPFQNVSPERALERRWHLLKMTRAGERVWETRDVSRLLEVADDGTLYFVRAGAETPNQWSVFHVLR